MGATAWTREQVNGWNRELATASPAEVAAWAAETFGDGLVVACSFSREDAVVVDLLSRSLSPVPVFALDTGRLPEETYQAAGALAAKYGLSIEWYFPEAQAVEQLLRQKGAYSFRESLENRHECCRIRKVEPLARALAARSAWVTGLRRDQSVTRETIDVVELDEAHGGIAKVNPLASWRGDQAAEYAASHGVPVHPLHQQGYPSIGCAPCTRAIQSGESERAGRWWWESPEHKECGLHPVADRSRG